MSNIATTNSSFTSANPGGTNNITLNVSGTVSAMNLTAISVGDGNTINIGSGTTVLTNTTINHSLGSMFQGTGPNTIEMGRNNTLTIMPNATDSMVSAMGVNQQSEAINVMGFGNILINRGTIFNNVSAAIWLQNNTGPVSYGTVSGTTTTASTPPYLGEN
jgi:hypothetical protein